MKYYIGQKVICVNASELYYLGDPNELNPPLIKGKVYEILAIDECDCGLISFDVGIHKKLSRCQCSCLRKTLTEIWWASSKRFLPLDDFKAVTFEKISEEVPMGVN